MNFITVGKIVNTHGIKGELRILSSLSEQEKKAIFQEGSHLIIDGISYEITSYRRHKNYDMVTFKNLTDINQVLFLKNKVVKKDISEIKNNSTEIYDFELLTYKVLTSDGKVGLIKEIETTGKDYKILRLEIEGKEVLLPKHKDFIEKIDKEKKTITVKLLSKCGGFHEN